MQWMAEFLLRILKKRRMGWSQGGGGGVGGVLTLASRRCVPFHNQAKRTNIKTHNIDIRNFVHFILLIPCVNFRSPSTGRSTALPKAVLLSCIW